MIDSRNSLGINCDACPKVGDRGREGFLSEKLASLFRRFDAHEVGPKGV